MCGLDRAEENLSNDLFYRYESGTTAFCVARASGGKVNNWMTDLWTEGSCRTSADNMSDYASRLSNYPNKGKCGLPENFDTERVMQRKLEKLYSLIKESNHVVVLTGAGISTSAGIADFRGPKGIWTLESRAKKKKEAGSVRKEEVDEEKISHDHGKASHSERPTKKRHRGDSTIRKSAPVVDGVTFFRSTVAEKVDNSEHTADYTPSEKTLDRDREVSIYMPLCAEKNFHDKNGITSQPQSSLATKDDKVDIKERQLSSCSSSLPASEKEKIMISSNQESTKESLGAHSSKMKQLVGECKKTPSSTFELAQPTYTHRAITSLINNNVVRHCITQNVDGLHIRSDNPRHKLSILHGCIFTETCEECHAEHFRSYDVGGISFQRTGRYCTQTINCNGPLRDNLLDWDDELPEVEFNNAQDQCKQADLILCLGTSLRIEPAGSLPLLGKHFVIINLQETPKDQRALLIIRARVDDVMKYLCEKLNVVVD